MCKGAIQSYFASRLPKRIQRSMLTALFELGDWKCCFVDSPTRNVRCGTLPRLHPFNPVFERNQT